MANEASAADHLRSNEYYPGLDYSLWPADTIQHAEDLCRVDTGNLDCVPEWLRPYVVKDCTPEGWLKNPPSVFNTPYKLARWHLAFDLSAPKPAWHGTGLTPSAIIAECNRLAEERAKKLQAELDSQSNLYFIGSTGGPIKIGIAGDVSKRLKQLQTANPMRLELLAVVKGAGMQEPVYHERFAEWRLEGEWFARCPEIEAEIARLNASGPHQPTWRR